MTTSAFNMDAPIERLERLLDWYDQKPGGNNDWCWTLKRLHDYAKALMDLSPLQLGDRVVLRDQPEITEEHSRGWMGSKHFIVKGALARVVEIDWDGEFTCSVVFDDESWVDSGSGGEGVIHPVEEKNKHSYNMNQRCFEKVLETAP